MAQCAPGIEGASGPVGLVGSKARWRSRKRNGASVGLRLASPSLEAVMLLVRVSRQQATGVVRPFARRLPALLACLLAASAACTSADRAPERSATEPLVLFNAAAISRPMRAVLDSFAARTGTKYAQETAASLEIARRVLELGGQPDVLVLADPDIFPQLLEPSITTWHALFARNRIVLAYTARSQGAAEIDSTN